MVWGGGYVWQKNEIRLIVNTTSGSVKKDFTDSGYAGSIFLYLSYGLFTAAWQTLSLLVRSIRSDLAS